MRWQTEFVRPQGVDEQVNRGLVAQTGLVDRHSLQEVCKSEGDRRSGEFRWANTFRSRGHAVAVNGGWKAAGSAGHRSAHPEKSHDAPCGGKEVSGAETVEADDGLVVAEAPVAEGFAEEPPVQSVLNFRHAAMLRVRISRGSPLML